MTNFIHPKQTNLNRFITGIYGKPVCTHVFTLSSYFSNSNNLPDCLKWRYFSISYAMIETFSMLAGTNLVSTHEQVLKISWNVLVGFNLEVMKERFWGSGVAKCILSTKEVSSFDPVDDKAIYARGPKPNFYKCYTCEESYGLDSHTYLYQYCCVLSAVYGEEWKQ